MQGVVFDIKRFAVHDGPGIRTTVFLKGCSLNCLWCHNPESISRQIETYVAEEKIGDKVFYTKKTIGKLMSATEVFDEIKKEQIFMEEGNGGITLSGGEPLLQIDFVAELLQLIKNSDIHTAVDTAGNVSQHYFEKIVHHTDLFLYDIKFIDEKKHVKYTGAGNELILSNFKYLIKNKKDIIVRIPLIPKANLVEKEWKDMAEFLSKYKSENFYRIDLMPYHHIGQAKYKRFNKTDRMKGIDEPDIKEIIPVKNYFEKSGFTVTIQ